MQRLLKQPIFKINNEAQLTNAFIKLVQAEIYTLEFRVKHESQNISDKKAHCCITPYRGAFSKN